MKYTINANFATEAEAELAQRKVANKVGSCFHVPFRRANVRVEGKTVVATGSVKQGVNVGALATLADKSLRGAGNYKGVTGFKSLTF